VIAAAPDIAPHAGARIETKIVPMSANKVLVGALAEPKGCQSPPKGVRGLKHDRL